MGKGDGARLYGYGQAVGVRGDGTDGIGMPQQQFIAGGDFATALSAMAAAKLLDVRRELREVDRETTLITPDNLPYAYILIGTPAIFFLKFFLLPPQIFENF